MISWFRENIKQFNFNMGQVYCISGISRQAYHKQLQRISHKEFVESRLVEMVKEIREDHPRMGARKLFRILELEGTIGVNKFEKMLSCSGMGIKQKKSAQITTDSNHSWFKYNNLTHGLKLTGVNQVWSSDITYYMIGESVYYITFMMDVYSRRILAYSVSDNMLHDNNVEVLKQSIKQRKGIGIDKLIHHSDKGSQYCAKAYINILNQNNVRISMAETSIENPYVERLNGIIKNDYLYPRNRAYDLKSLQKEVDRVVKLYNEVRPHSELNNLTPVEFEKKLALSKYKEDAEMELYNFERKRVQGFLKAYSNGILKEEEPASETPTGFDHSFRSDYPSESCSPAELSSVSSDKANIAIENDIQKISFQQ